MPEQQGIKHDQGKRRLGEMIIDFADSLQAVCGVWEFGADKYEKSNWKYVENAKDRYTNAMIRHLISEETEIIDSESELLHATHVAWNALARLHFILKGLQVEPYAAAIKQVKEQYPMQLKLDLGVSESDTPNIRYTYGSRCE